MASRRYELALDLIKPGDWRRFEQFGQLVLAGEFAGFRPTAAAAGDRGRDGELYSGPDPTVMFQLSVASDWRRKIRATAQRIGDEFPNAKVLVYVTNQRIGAASDDIRLEVHQDRGLFLDVRDRDWLLGRVAVGGVAETAAEQLAADIVDPHLADGATRRHATVLTDLESRAALTYLEMRWTDDNA